MSDAGRPHLLDEQKQAEICDFVSAGHSVASAARLMGCNVKTIRRHAERDERFARLLRSAEVAAQNDPLKLMRRAAGSSWRAAAWILERTQPEHYGRQPSAACRPEDVDRAFTRIMDIALGHVRGEAERRALYQDLAKVMEEETVQLFLPPSVRRASQKSHHTGYVNEQRLNDLFDSLSKPYDFPSVPPTRPQSPTTGPAAPSSSPKTSAARAASNPGKNQEPRC
jgi:hypothetical protein